MSPKLSFAFLVLSIVISVQSRPLDDEEVEIELAPPLTLDPSRLKQEDTEDEDVETTTPPYQFGAQVAQIITGAVTGDLSTILQGSFGLVPNPQTSSAINGAWGTIAGITSTTTTTTTTTTEATTTTAAPTEPPTARVAEPTEPTEGPEPPVVEEETEEPKFEEGTSSTTEISDVEEKVSSTTVGEDDDDDEEAEAEELDSRETKNISDNDSSNLEDNSVFSRSKVLRVI